MDQRQRDGIVFTILPGLGRRRGHRLLEVYSSCAEVLALSVEKLAGTGLNETTRQAVLAYQNGDFAAEYLRRVDDWLLDPRHHLIFWDDDNYPPMLRNIPDPPLILYVRGNLQSIYQPQLAIVGSRNASQSGLRNTRLFAAELSRAGFVITSGMALGVDGAAHQAAVDNQAPTVAVLGCGVDVVYPRRHAKLVESIVQHQGAIVSEYPLGTVPIGYNFPQRNRIISGLSAGVLVVEAALRSGSLITARQALEQGREVFALPSTLNNPQGHGCHALIREGATLVETVQHIIEPLASLLGSYVPEDTESGVIEEPAVAVNTSALPADAERILQLIDYDFITLDALVSRAGLPAEEVMAQLVGLELEGFIEQHPEGYIRI